MYCVRNTKKQVCTQNLISLVIILKTFLAKYKIMFMFKMIYMLTDWISDSKYI